MVLHCLQCCSLIWICLPQTSQSNGSRSSEGGFGGGATWRGGRGGGGGGGGAFCFSPHLVQTSDFSGSSWVHL